MSKLKYILDVDSYGNSVLSLWKTSYRLKNVHVKFQPKDKELRDTFIPQVLLKKLDMFQIPISLPDPLLELITICSCNNPGYAQILLIEIIKRIPNKADLLEIRPEDFDRIVTDWGFPILLKPDIEERFSKLWEEQKTWQKAPTVDYTGNLVDSKSYWKDLLK